MSNRVAVTGVGVISSIGAGFEDFSAALRAGTNGSGSATVIDVGRFRTSIACEVEDFDPAPWFRRTSPATVGRAARFAVAAARMAVADAFGDDSLLTDTPGVVIIGTSDGGSHEIDALVRSFSDDGAGSLDPEIVAQVPHDGISRAIVTELGLTRTESFVNGNACAAGNQAIGLAADAIATGDVDYAIAGGADALCRRAFAAFSRLNLMSPGLCQPFDVDRQGLLIGEGSAVLVLENLDAAVARGATIYAEVLGYGANCDSHSPVQPLVQGVANCIRIALERSGISAAQVDMVSAHGTATPTNDVAEAAALRLAFGPTSPPVTAVKSMLGHTMGAAGAMGAIACIVALRAQEIPPTINHEALDPRCEIDVVAHVARAATLTIAQNNAFGFFGNNAVSLFARYEEEATR